MVSTDRWYIGDEWSGKWKRNHLGSVWRFYFGFVQKTIIYCFIYYFKINSLEIVSLEAKFAFLHITSSDCWSRRNLKIMKVQIEETFGVASRLKMVYSVLESNFMGDWRRHRVIIFIKYLNLLHHCSDKYDYKYKYKYKYKYISKYKYKYISKYKYKYIYTNVYVYVYGNINTNLRGGRVIIFTKYLYLVHHRFKPNRLSQFLKLIYQYRFLLLWTSTTNLLTIAMILFISTSFWIKRFLFRWYTHLDWWRYQSRWQNHNYRK